MTKRTEVGGNILYGTNGNYTMYTEEEIRNHSHAQIVQNGFEGGISFNNPEKPVNKRNAHVIFIGGAGDKYSYLGSGPNYNIKYAKEFFDNVINSTKLGNRVKTSYLGFNEVCPESNVTNNILSNIANRVDPVYVIGHSLGGWNAVYTASFISRSGNNIRMLMTLDPVGTKNGVHWISELYKPNEQGLYKGNKYRWYNIRNNSKKKDFSDIVASAGGQAVIVSGSFGNADSTIDVNINHRFAKAMFTAKLYDKNNKSLLDILKNDVLSQLK